MGLSSPNNLQISMGSPKDNINNYLDIPQVQDLEEEKEADLVIEKSDRLHVDSRNIVKVHNDEGYQTTRLPKELNQNREQQLNTLRLASTVLVTKNEEEKQFFETLGHVKPHRLSNENIHSFIDKNNMSNIDK